jgi:hypothetical protein
MKRASSRTQPKRQAVVLVQIEISSFSIMISSSTPQGTGISVTLVDKMLLLLVERKLSKCERRVFMNRTSVNSRTIILYSQHSVAVVNVLICRGSLQDATS